MNYNQFSNLSCYEEFEIRSALTGISKVDVLKVIGHQIDDYYFLLSKDGVFNWFDLNGNHVENPCVLKTIKEKYIPKTITKCIIPNGVISIGYGAFWGCESLKEINIPDSVISISYGAFWGCESLKEINIPDSVISIGYGAFWGCESLKEINIPDSVISIGECTFYCCTALKEIIIPNSVTSIGNDAFLYCESLISITITNSVTRISRYTFCDCKSLKEVIFKGKTLKEVKQMKNYPFGIEDESIIKCET